MYVFQSFQLISAQLNLVGDCPNYPSWHLGSVRILSVNLTTLFYWKMHLTVAVNTEDFVLQCWCWFQDEKGEAKFMKLNKNYRIHLGIIQRSHFRPRFEIHKCKPLWIIFLRTVVEELMTKAKIQVTEYLVKSCNALKQSFSTLWHHHSSLAAIRVLLMALILFPIQNYSITMCNIMLLYTKKKKSCHKKANTETFPTLGIAGWLLISWTVCQLQAPLNT